MATRQRKTATTRTNDAAATSGLLATSAAAIESRRLAALRTYHILDTPPEPGYDDITLLAAQICDTPISLVTLVDSTRQWFKSRIGMERTEVARHISFCSYAILQPKQVMLVEDAAVDPRFCASALVTGESGIRFYAGAPVVTPDGDALGTVCVMDRVPRSLNARQAAALQALARQIMFDLELRRVIEALKLKDKFMNRLAQDNALLREHSLTDELTVIPNRRAFSRQLAMAASHARRHGEALSLVIFDVDRFKSFNDDFGHPVGDEVLRGVAAALQTGARRGDFVARYGGEEFAVICPGATEEQAHAVADRLRKAVAAINWKHRAVTVSAGVAALAKGSLDDGELMVESADHALYQAKANGRNTVVGFASLPTVLSSGGRSS